ncbi:hypothetical protein ScPMuIL_008110 [Solemya velum]
MTVLNDEQQRAFAVMASGHNVAILGQAGTGKTMLVREGVKRLRERGKCVTVTASTGMAARQYKDATTVHHWAGLLYGRYDNKELLSRIRASEDQSIVERIKTADILVIDENSMISSKTFEQVEFVCRHLREPGLFFGNLQVICVGDFYQLRPVPDDLHNDPGHYVFTSPVWQSTITHKITLTQDDRDQVVLYGTNLEVDVHNTFELRKLDAPMTVFRSEDSGDVSLLSRVLAKKVLTLKVGCPVMLIRNMSRSLVNGLIGKVVAISAEGPTVKFGNDIVKLNKVSFSVYDSNQHMVVANREQFPVTLSFAITVYKSQGLTIPKLVVNCNGIRQPGEIGVAVGRSVNVDGLCIRNYSPSCSKQHPQEVVVFHQDAGLPIADDFSCCKRVFDEENLGNRNEDTYIGEWSDESDFDENDLHFIEELETQLEAHAVQPPIPAAAAYQVDDVESLLNQLYTTGPITDPQIQLNSDIDHMKTEPRRVADFLNKQHDKLKQMKEDIDAGMGGKSEKLGKFFKGFHKYIGSPDYQAACSVLFSGRPVNPLLTGTLITEVRKSVVKEQQDKSDDPITTIKSLPASSHRKIRLVRSDLDSKGMDLDSKGMVLDKGAHIRVNLLRLLTKTQSEVMEESQYPDSLKDVYRKQNLSCGLTNISDKTFEYFLMLETKRLPLYSATYLKVHGSDVFTK